MDYCVFLETNILVSSSIYLDFNKNGKNIPVKHKFYDACRPMINKALKYKIGYTSTTVFVECLENITRIAIETLEEYKANHPTISQLDKEDIIKLTDDLKTQSRANLDSLAERFDKPPIDTKRRNTLVKEIEPFLKELYTKLKEARKRNPKLKMPDPPDHYDIKIFSVAVVIYRDLKKPNFYFASTDSIFTHTLCQQEIARVHGIKTVWPGDKETNILLGL